MAELALIRSLPNFIIDQKIKPGRLKNICLSLAEITDIAIKNLPILSIQEMLQALELLLTWGKKTGWLDNKKHTVSLCSFLLAMVEESQFKYDQKIIDHLNELFEYFERIGDAKQICLYAGNVANNKWCETKRSIEKFKKNEAISN